jgi:hypothetical protein
MRVLDFQSALLYVLLRETTGTGPNTSRRIHLERHNDQVVCI